MKTIPGCDVIQNPKSPLERCQQRGHNSLQFFVVVWHNQRFANWSSTDAVCGTVYTL